MTPETTAEKAPDMTPEVTGRMTSDATRTASGARTRVRCAIGVGGNQGDPEGMIELAWRRLAGLGRPLARSPIYETEPVGPPQPAYLNAVFLLDTTLEPRALLRRLQEIEDELGRVRAERWGPRTIDLDLLFHGDTCCADEELELPHPRLHERAFALLPLRDVAPDWRHPRLDATVGELCLAGELVGAVRRRLRAAR